MRIGRKISKVEVSDLFWRDIGQWRGHADYYPIRRTIAEMVLNLSRGEPGGDKPFSGGTAIWQGIRHKHLPAKLICFTMYPDQDVLRLCAVKKHDFYGFRNERKSRAEDAARKVRGAGEREPTASPGWAQLRWDTPGQILRHPELPELSNDGLLRLHGEILNEQDSLAKLEKSISDQNLDGAWASDFMEQWMTDLVDAQECVENMMVEIARRRENYLTPEDFEPWADEMTP